MSKLDFVTEPDFDWEAPDLSVLTPSKYDGEVINGRKVLGWYGGSGNLMTVCNRGHFSMPKYKKAQSSSCMKCSSTLRKFSNIGNRNHDYRVEGKYLPTETIIQDYTNFTPILIEVTNTGGVKQKAYVSKELHYTATHSATGETKTKSLDEWRKLSRYENKTILVEGIKDGSLLILKTGNGKTTYRCDCEITETVETGDYHRKPQKVCKLCKLYDGAHITDSNYNLEDYQKYYVPVKKMRKNANKTLPFTLLPSDIAALYPKDGASPKCYYCKSVGKLGKSLNKGQPQLQIDSMEYTLGHVAGNIVLACKNCNFGKNDSPLSEFKEGIKQTFLHLNNLKTPNQSKKLIRDRAHRETKTICNLSVLRKWSHAKSSAKSQDKRQELDMDNLHKVLSQPCVYTGLFNEPTSKNPDGICGIDKIDSSSYYHDDNIQPVITFINALKGQQTHDQFLAHLKRLWKSFGFTGPGKTNRCTPISTVELPTQSL